MNGETTRSYAMSGGDLGGSNGAVPPPLTKQSSTLSIHLCESQVGKEAQHRPKPTRNDYTEGLGLVYAILLVIFGIIFPMAEALQDEWLRTEYHLIFQLYLTVVAIAFIVYLQFYELRCHHDDHHVTKPSAFNLVGTIRRGDDGLMTLSSDQKSSNERSSFYLGSKDTTGMKRISSDASVGSEDNGMAWLDLSTIGSIFDHEGSSLFLRLGTLMFAIGNMIYVCLEIEHAMGDPPEGCKKQTYGWVYLFRFFFVLLQTYFLLKNRSIHVHKHLSLIRLGYHHLIATNLCIWIRTLTSEILEEYLHHMHHHEDETSNLTMFGNASMALSGPSVMAEGCLVYSGVLMIVTPFLFPFVLEYSLIAMGTVAIFVVELNDLVEFGSNQMVKGLHNLIKVPKFLGFNNEDNHDMNAGHDDTTSKSNTGIYGGGLMLAAVIVSSILFFYALDNNLDEAQLIYLSTDIGLNTVMLIATLGVIHRMHPLAFVAKPTSVDDLLLMISLAGAVTFEVAIMTSTATYLADVDQDYLHVMTLISALLSTIQVIVQVFAVMSGLRRYPANEEQVKTMPGRGLLSLLIMANVSGWIFRTMETKKSDVYVADNFYGISAWLIISNISLPLLLFYRFHSAVCLADIWHQGYVPLATKVAAGHMQNGHAGGSGQLSRTNSAIGGFHGYANNNFVEELDRNVQESTVHL